MNLKWIITFTSELSLTFSKPQGSPNVLKPMAPSWLLIDAEGYQFDSVHFLNTFALPSYVMINDLHF